VTVLKPGAAFGIANRAARKPTIPKPVAPPFVYTYDVTTAKKVHKQSRGIVVVEAEDFDAVDHQDHRTWYLTTADHIPDVKPDPDPNHAKGACAAPVPRTTACTSASTASGPNPAPGSSSPA
jgi:hypothetical protein